MEAFIWQTLTIDWREEEKGTTEDEMVGWHHQLDGHESEQALGVGDGQGGLACCSPWGHQELDRLQITWYIAGFVLGTVVASMVALCYWNLRSCVSVCCVCVWEMETERKKGAWGARLVRGWACPTAQCFSGWWSWRPYQTDDVCMHWDLQGKEATVPRFRGQMEHWIRRS